MRKHLLIAIDGPAGAGKSTIARHLAEQLGITYIDTGAMYRAAAWKMLKNGINVTIEDQVTELIENTSISLDRAGISVDGVRLDDSLIRTPNVSNCASDIAKIQGVRRILVKTQQEIARAQSVVMDGRDIGTHVLPHADLKIFLTASIEQRARRRYQELIEKGISADIKTLQEEIQRRDENDQKRKYSPLKQAEDAILIDTTDKSIEEIVEGILYYCKGYPSEKKFT